MCIVVENDEDIVLLDGLLDTLFIVSSYSGVVGVCACDKLCLDDWMAEGDNELLIDVDVLTDGVFVYSLFWLVGFSDESGDSDALVTAAVVICSLN